MEYLKNKEKGTSDWNAASPSFHCTSHFAVSCSGDGTQRRLCRCLVGLGVQYNMTWVLINNTVVKKYLIPSHSFPSLILINFLGEKKGVTDCVFSHSKMSMWKNCNHQYDRPDVLYIKLISNTIDAGTFCVFDGWIFKIITW